MANFDTANYIITTHTIDNTNITLRTEVKGFWSSDVITAYVRFHSFSENPYWSYTISNSSGGRDTEAVPSDIEAYGYYAEALIALAAELEKLKETEAERTEAYFRYVEELRAKSLAEKKAKQEAWDNETPITLEEATAIIEELSDLASTNKEATGKVFRRGTGRTKEVEIKVVLSSKYLDTRSRRSFFIGAHKMAYQSLLNELTVSYVL